jgi:hypothetical protein
MQQATYSYKISFYSLSHGFTLAQNGIEMGGVRVRGNVPLSYIFVEY